MIENKILKKKTFPVKVCFEIASKSNGQKLTSKFWKTLKAKKIHHKTFKCPEYLKNSSLEGKIVTIFLRFSPSNLDLNKNITHISLMTHLFLSVVQNFDVYFWPNWRQTLAGFFFFKISFFYHIFELTNFCSARFLFFFKKWPIVTALVTLLISVIINIL